MPRGVPKAGFRNISVNKNVGQLAAKSEPVVFETDDQIRDKLRTRFDAMNQTAEASFNGHIKSLIISGPAGLGKSYGVMKIAEEMATQGKSVELVKGFVRPTGLYKVLYENRHEHCVVIFDDADAVFFDEDSLSILKTACDMTRDRWINWRAETTMRDEADEKIPTKYKFEGTIIFITNTDFDFVIKKEGKLAPHFAAMVSRSLYLDLGMKTNRDYFIRMEQVVQEGMLTQIGMSHQEQVDLMVFVETHIDDLRELSLRMLVKISSLVKMSPGNWKNLAKVTCFKSK
jgi:hypothetical protein